LILPFIFMIEKGATPMTYRTVSLFRVSRESICHTQQTDSL
jgi:hypothetical protein